MKNEYFTNPKDYTGCDPVIADHLKRELDIKCKEGWCTGYSRDGVYCINGKWCTEATPLIKPETKLKPFHEIIRLAADKGAKFTESRLYLPSGGWFCYRDLLEYDQDYEYINWMMEW